MKKIFLLNILFILFLLFNIAGCTKKYTPETKDELKALIDNESISLDEISTSKITDMSNLFRESRRKNFQGIENWDVSQVDNMSGMFDKVKFFNEDISRWNVSKVKNMSKMFSEAVNFNQNIGSWDVSSVEDM